MPDNICPKCGQRNKPEAQFCGGCGTPFGAAADPGGGNQTLFLGSGMQHPEIPQPPPASQAQAAPPEEPATVAMRPAAPPQGQFPPAGSQPVYQPPGAAAPPAVTPPPAAAAPAAQPPVAQPPAAGPPRQIQSMPKGPPSRSRPVAGPMGGGLPSAPQPLVPQPGVAAPMASPPMAAPPMAAPPQAVPPQAAPPAVAPGGAPPPTVSPLSGMHAPGVGQPTGPTPTAAGPEEGDLVGKTLNRRYLVEAHIGEGGFGDVYRAKQIQMDREVAIKVLAPGMTQDEKLVERFRREAKSACNLRDPHTIITYDFDETEDGLLYIAMELLQGETLFDVMEVETLLPAPRVAGILEQSCTSLGEAHSMGIVHRDIKPENIFLEHRPDYPDFVKVLDFGIAKIVAGDLAAGPQLTAAGQTLGTLEYMSPEQLMGKELDGRSDIYALGMMAYQMLTGTLPFSDSSPAAIIQWHLKKLPEPASRLVPSVPADFDPIISKMIAKDRDERYAAVSELREDVRQLMARHGWLVGGSSGPMTAVPAAPLPSAAGQAAAVSAVQPAPVTAGTPGMMPQSAVPQKKSPIGLIIAIVLLVLGLAGAAVWYFVLRGSGDDGKSSGKSKGGDAMSKSRKARPRPMARRAAAMREAAMRPPPRRAVAARQAPMRPAARRPSLGGLLGVLGGGSSGGGAAKSAGGLGALVGKSKLPEAGPIVSGRRARAAIKASEKDPLRVVPPEMTLWGQVDLDGLRETAWGRRLLDKIPPKATQMLAKMGLSPRKVGKVALGVSFAEGAGKDEPILLIAVSGKVKVRALLKALKKAGGKLQRTQVSGYKVVIKDDMHLALPSNRLLLFSSKEVLKAGLSRMSQKRVKSAVAAGWGKTFLKTMGVSATPDLLLALPLSPAMQKQSTELLKQLKAGDNAHVKNLMLFGVASKAGLAVTLGATCSSASVALKLKMVLPLVLKMLTSKVPPPFNALLSTLRVEVKGNVVALRLDLDRRAITLLTALILKAAQ